MFLKTFEALPSETEEIFKICLQYKPHIGFVCVVPGISFEEGDVDQPSSAQDTSVFRKLEVLVTLKTFTKKCFKSVNKDSDVLTDNLCPSCPPKIECLQYRSLNEGSFATYANS